MVEETVFVLEIGEQDHVAQGHGYLIIRPKGTTAVPCNMNNSIVLGVFIHKYAKRVSL